ncbi:MAG: hypothetical protein ACK502_00910 [Alphaproteobacteria bacterium]
MPHSEQHRSQRRKNLALFLFLLVLIALLYAITIMRLKGMG